MSNDIFLLTNTWLSGASASSTNEHTNFPFSNLLLDLPSRYYRSNNLTTIRGTFDAGSSKPWDTIFLGYGSFTAAGTWKIYAGDTLGTLFTSPDYESSLFFFRLDDDLDDWTYWHALHTEATPVTARYIGLEFTDAGNTDGYIRIGACRIGELFTVPIGFSADSEGWNWEDRSVEVSLKNGETTYRRQRPRMVGQFELPWQVNTTTYAWRRLSRIYGNSTPMMIKTTSGEQHDQDDTCYGYVTIRTTHRSLIDPRYSDVSVLVREV